MLSSRYRVLLVCTSFLLSYLIEAAGAGSCLQIAESVAKRGIVGTLWSKEVARLEGLPSPSDVGCDKANSELDYRHTTVAEGHHFHLKDACTDSSTKVADICMQICQYLRQCVAYEAFGGSAGFNCILFSQFQGFRNSPAAHGIQKLTGSGYGCATPPTTTTRACSWTPHEDSYSMGHAGGVSTDFDLAGAQNKCIELGTLVCKAVTCKVHGACTVRASETLGSSTISETSYIPLAICFETTTIEATTAQTSTTEAPTTTTQACSASTWNAACGVGMCGRIGDNEYECVAKDCHTQCLTQFGSGSGSGCDSWGPQTPGGEQCAAGWAQCRSCHYACMQACLTTTTTQTIITTTRIVTTTTSMMSTTLIRGTTTTTTIMSLVGSFTIEVSNRSSFVNEPNVTFVMTLAIAAMINVSVSWIHDVSVTIADDRRLHASLRIGRTLQATDPALSATTESGVKIDFRVVIPPDPQGDVIITPSIILERFDSVDLKEATDLIDKVIRSNLLLGGVSSYNVKVAYKIIRKEEEPAPPAPSPPPYDGGQTTMLVIAGISAGLALSLVFLTFACCYVVRRKTKEQSQALLKARVVAASESKAQFLFPPSVLTLDCRNMLYSFLQEVLEEDATVFITFAMDTRPDDVENCCPDAFYAAAVAQALRAQGVRCYMSLPGLTSGERCHRLLSEPATTCKTLVMIETAALFESSKCLREIHAAQENGIEATRLRFGASLPLYSQWWSDVESNELQMAAAVKQRLKLLPQLPEPPLTVQLQPGVLETFAHELKLKLSILSLGKLDDEGCMASIPGIGIIIRNSGSSEDTVDNRCPTTSIETPPCQNSIAWSEASADFATQSTAASTEMSKTKSKRVKTVRSGSGNRGLGQTSSSEEARSLKPLRANKSSDDASESKKADLDCFGKARTDTWASTGSPGKQSKSPSPARTKHGNQCSGGRRPRPAKLSSSASHDTSQELSRQKSGDATPDRSSTDQANNSAPIGKSM